MTIKPPSNSPAPLPPTNPYHIARAYGVQAPGRASGGSSSAAATTSSSSVPEAVRPEGVRKLVAGVVPGGVAFDAGGSAQPSSPGASLPMYRHPADRNAAATAVSVGRSLDVRG